MPALRVIERQDTADGGPFAHVERELHALLSSNDESGVCRTVDAMLEHAVASRGTDVHLEPWERETALRFRIDGLLHDAARLPQAFHARIVARIKILAKMVTYLREAPQDGRIDVGATSCRKSIRVSTFPTVNGERVVLRIMDSVETLLDLDALGFSQDLVGALRARAHSPQGTVVFTGPSSSGKTTTIYALLRELATMRTPTPHIVTIEDPVERRLPSIAQTEIAPHHGLTFDTALRSLLRQDPEVIAVGEVRDAETARAAIQAGLTGHLVLCTIHSGTAAGVFARLLDMGIEPYLVASSITAVLAQRLVRRICSSCKTAVDDDNSQAAEYGIEPGLARHRGAGCAACRGIGYSGRMAIGELLTVSETFAERILARSRTSELHAAALQGGMEPLATAGARLVREGVTTLEELRRVLPQGVR